MSRSSQPTPRSAATRSMTARASSHRWQPGRPSNVILGPVILGPLVAIGPPRRHLPWVLPRIRARIGPRVWSPRLVPFWPLWPLWPLRVVTRSAGALRLGAPRLVGTLALVGTLGPGRRGL